MDALETFGDDRVNAKQLRAFGRPIARGAGTVFFAGDDNQWNFGLLKGFGGFVDRGALAVRAQREAAFDAGYKQILEPDIGEGSSDHHLVIATACAIRVEVLGLYAIGN